ncbi:MAG: putative deacylase [Bacteriovoracaceae bacterium]|jgi:predicted deacylase
MSKKLRKRDPDILTIGGTKIPRGTRKRIQLDFAALYDYTELTIPVEVIRGAEKGPILFISAAVHGDEVNGVEIIKKLLKKAFLKRIKGTLILVPVVNVFGFNNKSRYLPDRRDLNRSFPGSKSGSLAGRLAHTFMKEIVSKCTHGIDLHTGAIHRTNLPQIRACLDDEETKDLAEGFGVPVVIDSMLRDGSLREAARKKNISMLLFEGGQALRFENNVIRIGVRGCVSVMNKIGMLDNVNVKQSSLNASKMYIAKSSYWTRAPHSGAFSSRLKIGERVEAGDVLATITDSFGRNPFVVTAEESGILIGSTLLPLVNQGDAMFHIAVFKNSTRVRKALDMHDDFENE